jgi:alkylation response protein AidB-like acyl-CoA dehydrogenase
MREYNDEQLMLQESVRKLMERWAPRDYLRRIDSEAQYPYELYEKFAEAGLFRMPFPEEYGGLGGDVIDLAIIARELSRKSFDVFTAWGTVVFTTLTLLKFGSEEQKSQLIPEVLAGKRRMSVSITEPGAGSDVGAMKTSARPQGNGWVVNGQKVFSTAAGAKNNIIQLYARTDAAVRHQDGISLFLVPNDLPGVTLRNLDMLGRRGTGTYEVFFDDVHLPADALVGEVNRGWRYLLAGLQLERLTTSAGYCGGMEGVIDLALNYAKERKQFGRPIGEFQAIGHMLADMRTDFDAGSLLMWRAAEKLRSGEDALLEVSTAKLFCSEAYVRLANMGMQILGGYGYTREFDMQQHFRDSRSTTIGAGSSQMQRNIIAGLMGLKLR